MTDRIFTKYHKKKEIDLSAKASLPRHFRLYLGRNFVPALYYVLAEKADRGGHIWTKG